MRLAKLAFPGAIFLGLAFFALRSPIPAADPRFIQDDFPGPGAPISFNLYLSTGYPRELAHKTLNDCVKAMRARETAAAAAPARVRAEALDDAVQRLKAVKIVNVMARFGPNLVVRGKRGNAPWRIGLRNPRGTRPDDALAYLLGDRDEAVAAAGTERVVTVIGPDGPAAADQADALLAAKPDQWRELARKGGIEQVMVVEADGSIVVTEPLNGRLKFLHGAEARVVP